MYNNPIPFGGNITNINIRELLSISISLVIQIINTTVLRI